MYTIAGVLSGDPMYGRADSFWDDAGGSGLSQMEGSLGRRFPLHDSYLTLPLWGQQTAGRRIHCILILWELRQSIHRMLGM